MDNKEPENKDNNNQLENLPKKRGRPKKYDFAGLSKEEYDKKWYEINKEKLQEKFKKNYIDNKDEIKEKSKEHQNKYRDSYKLLIDLYTNNEINTSEEKYEKIKKIIFQ